MLSQLIYVSKRKSNTGQAELEQILAASEKNNPTIDVTGVLLCSQVKFIGFLEGKYEHVMRTYNRIKKDERHEDVKIFSLRKNQAKSRLFPVWIMGGRSLDDEGIKLDTNHSDEVRSFFESMLGVDAEEHELAMKTIRQLFD